MSELKPCPFCGCEAFTWEEEDEWPKSEYVWHAECRECEIEVWPHKSEAEAIEAWNRRANDGD